ncbi:MAG: phosphoadenosine phosphosulfate reductase family protein [Caldilineaceae bacterium]
MSASSPIAIASASGIPRISVLNSGRFYNGRKHLGEGFRVFPLSNWTEMDIWQYIRLRRSRSPRSTSPTSVTSSTGTACCWPRRGRQTPLPGEQVQPRRQRFRTIGDMTCTGAVDRRIQPGRYHLEVALGRVTERGARADDKRSEAAMEDRKKQGYF